MKQYTDIEFELNDDADIDEDLDLKFNFYENAEINIDGFIENGVEVENKCLRCWKNYMRRSFFDKHVAQCVKSMVKKVEGMHIIVIYHLRCSFSPN